MPEALVLGVGALASAASLFVLLGTFAYVALYALLYRVAPIVMVYAGYSLLTDPIAFCASNGGAWCELAGGGAAAYDAVGALLITSAAGAVAAARTRCWMAQTIYAGAWAGALMALAADAPAVVELRVTQCARAAAALALCHAATPLLSKKFIGDRKQK